MQRLPLATSGILTLLADAAMFLRPERDAWDPFGHVGPAFAIEPPAAAR